MDNKIEKRMQEIEAKNLKPKFKIMHIGELLDIEFPDTEWLIEKLVPSECITILSGMPSSFKTWLFLQMAVNIAEGGKFLEQFKSTKASVLIINEEDHPRILQKRLNLLGSNRDMTIHLMSQGDFSVSNEIFVAEIIRVCKEKEIGVVFLDSLVRISDADENDAKEMSTVFKRLRKFCQAGITVVITHHERKEGSSKAPAQVRLRGSSDILAAIDSHLAIRKDPHDKQRLYFEQTKLRLDTEVEPFIITVIDDFSSVKFEYSGPNIGDNAKKKKEIREMILKIIGENSGGLSKKEITKRVRGFVEIGEKEPRKIINSMIKDGEVISKSGRGNEKLCFLAETSEKTEPP